MLDRLLSLFATDEKIRDAITEALKGATIELDFEREDEETLTIILTIKKVKT